MPFLWKAKDQDILDLGLFWIFEYFIDITSELFENGMKAKHKLVASYKPHAIACR